MPIRPEAAQDLAQSILAAVGLTKPDTVEILAQLIVKRVQLDEVNALIESNAAKIAMLTAIQQAIR